MTSNMLLHISYLIDLSFSYIYRTYSRLFYAERSEFTQISQIYTICILQLLQKVDFNKKFFFSNKEYTEMNICVWTEATEFNVRHIHIFG